MNNGINDFYKKFYNLKTLKIKVSSKSVAFLIYDDNYYYYLKNSDLLDTDYSVNVLETIKILNKEFNLVIINFYPVCFCEETLVIAFRILSTNQSCLNKVNYKKAPNKYKKIIDYHKNNFEKSYLSKNVNTEIQMSQRYINRYKFHEKFIKKYILTDKLRKKDEFKSILNDIIPNYKSIMDVSCGDNFDVLQIAKSKKYDVIVGNDVCINYLNNKILEGVIYTNDDVQVNNINSRVYDVTFCRNTLHHMNNKSKIKGMLKFLDQITSKEIIIVEICNPKEQGGLPKFFNKWLYVKYLKDVGDCFLNENQFKNIIKNTFKNYSINFDTFSNILGVYMIALIKKEIK